MKIRVLFNWSWKAVLCPALLIGCTDLEIEPTDSIISDSGSGSIFNGVENVESALNGVYNETWGDQATQENWYALSEVTSDAQLIPTRGTDWGDNGIWRQLHAHTWTPNHQFILNTWNNFNRNVLLASEVIDDLSQPSDMQKAEAQFLRAYNMFIILDVFGQVPFREPDEGVDVLPRVLTSQEAYDFILNDLNAAIAVLPNAAPGDATLNRATKPAANFLKAKVLLNSAIYKGTGTFDAADMQGVVDAVTEIEAAGFDLAAGYFDLFIPGTDTETIWWAQADIGSRIWNTLHYAQDSDDTGGGWNGFSTLAEFYDLFEGDPNINVPGSGQEERRGFVPDETTANNENYGIGYGFLIGQQYDRDGTPLEDRSGNPLSFKKEIPGLTGATETDGIRIIKYPPADNSRRSHLIMFRYSDAYLMKAEAMMRMGQDPTSMVNTLRALRNASALGTVGEQEMIDERGRELYAENWRRNDLVRFGKFTDEWEFKNPDAVGDETKNLFPIPTNALLSNPNLVQNPGY